MNHCRFRRMDTKGAVGNTVYYSSLTRDLPDEVNRTYWKQVFWTDSYFVTTVGTNSLAVVQDYIKNQ